jgi:aromatic ring-cleaving dioxygenase
MHEASPETWVLWAHASNAARLEQSFRDIADRVKIAGRQDPQGNIFKLVHDWMCDSKERWLLVLDNVDDAGFLLNTPGAGLENAARPLREYLPHCERGSIVVTTRNGEAALKLVEQRDIIALRPMSEGQAQTLLRKKLGVHVAQEAQDDNKTIAELATALEYMPLAIVQAAAYISQRAPLCSVAQYLDWFKKSERKRTSLLDYDEGQLRRDWEAKNSIITTWQISFEHIQQTRPSAADLLSLMSFFDRQGIPRSALQIPPEHDEGGASRDDDEAAVDCDEEDDRLQSECTDGGFEYYSEDDFEDDFEDDLDNNAKNDSQNDSQNDSPDDFEDNSEDSDLEDDALQDDVTVLRNFCFISINTNGTGFEMHALVQLSMRTWLAANSKLERCKEQFINNLSAVFPTGEHENWAACQMLFAHAKAATGHKPRAASSLMQWATLLHHAAWYAWRKGIAGDAQILAVQAMKARGKVLGQEHEDTIWSMALVAYAYSSLGRWDDAQKLEVQVVEKRKAKLGDDHPYTLMSMGNLALTYSEQGRQEEAEKLGAQVLEKLKMKLGDDHPDTLASMANLASIYSSQGRWKEAEELELQVVEKRKVKLGDDHPDTLANMANLASTYSSQGRWEEAEELELQVVEELKMKLGDDHPDTLTSMANLATTYNEQGRQEEAQELGLQVMEKRKAKLGDDHPDTLLSMAHLALMYCEQGRWEEAEELGLQVVEKRKAKLGDDHPDTLTSMANLASAYHKQRQWEEAEELGLQVVEKRKAKLGNDHPDTLTSMANLASTYWDQGHCEKAEKLHRDTLALREEVLTKDHPETLMSICWVAYMLKKRRRFKDALPLYERACKGYATTLGPDNPTAKACARNYAFVRRMIADGTCASVPSADSLSSPEDPDMDELASRLEQLTLSG